MRDFLDPEQDHCAHFERPPGSGTGSRRQKTPKICQQSAEKIQNSETSRNINKKFNLFDVNFFGV